MLFRRFCKLLGICLSSRVTVSPVTKPTIRLADKSKNINVSFVISIQAALAIVISAAIIKIFNMGSLFGTLTRADVIVGFMLFVSMYTSNLALHYVNYPFMVLAKSAKVLPVIMIGWIRGIYKLERY